MPTPTAKELRELLDRYRADLEDIDRRIRIVEWVAEGQRQATKGRSA